MNSYAVTWRKTEMTGKSLFKVYTLQKGLWALTGWPWLVNHKCHHNWHAVTNVIITGTQYKIQFMISMFSSNNGTLTKTSTSSSTKLLWMADQDASG